MSTEIEKHHIVTFSNNVTLLSQQRKSRLEPYVTTQPCMGKGAVVADQLGTVTVKKKTLRHEDTKYSDTARARRWLIPEECYTAELYDKSDLIRMLTDPQSPLVQVHVAAMERAKDAAVLACVFAAARVGEQVTDGTAAYDTGNDIAADIDLSGTPSGLTPFKLVKSKGRLMRNKVDVDAELPTMAINTKAWEDMFGQAVFTSGDYNPNKPMAQAPTAINYGGVNLVQIEHDDFPVNATTEWYLPCWVKSGIVLGHWGAGREITVQQVPGKISSWEVKIIEHFGATRVEEAKVVRQKIKY